MIISHIGIHLFHIIFVGTLFLYISINRDKTPKFMFPLLIYLGIIIILYHTYKAYFKLLDGKSAWINYIHIILIGPLLLFIGLNGKDTSRKYFELLLMTGMASIGYHGYYLFFL